MWSIFHEELSPGEKRQTVLRPDGYELPATLICGKEPGKTLLVTAQIHAGEYNGTPAVIRAAREIDPEKLKGNVILLHCVNSSGFWGQHWRTLPEDGFNLNSDFPGRPDGTTGERLANWFVREIFPKTDFLVDLHGGSVNEVLSPCLFFPAAPKVREESLRAAMALDVPNLVASRAEGGEYSYGAVHCNIPGLLLECGYGGFCREEWFLRHKRNIFLLLAHLGIYPLVEPPKDYVSHVFENAVYLESSQNGLWYSLVEAGEHVKRGQPLGRLEDLFGNVLCTFYAEDDAVVLYYTAGLAVNKGDALVAYGLL